VLGATIAIAVACGDARELMTRTVILPPAAGGEAFEPTIAIDPAHPERLTVAAMYGVPFARGGTGIWVWQSTDSGRTWTDSRLNPPGASVEAKPTTAADVVAGYAGDGTPLLATMSGVTSLGALSKGTFLSRLTPDPPTARSLLVYHNAVDSAAGRQLIYDKPWLVVDHLEESPYRGQAYFSVGSITAGLGPAGIGVDWKPLASQLMLAVSIDGGQSFSKPTVVADSAFGGYLAVGRGGVLEIAYMRLKNKDGSGDALFHRRSTDGGATLEPPATITVTSGDTLLDLPSLATRPNGDTISCWAQGVRTDERTNQVRCAVRRSGAPWSPPISIESALAPDVVPAWPTVVGTARGWYLMLYLVGRTRTEVALFRSADGSAFAKVTTLSTVDGLGVDRFCVIGSTPCRRTRKDAFVIGDYVALDASGGRLAAADVLPRPNGPLAGTAAIHVTTLHEPSR